MFRLINREFEILKHMWHSQIHEYGHVRNGLNGHRNVDYDRTYKEHRNLGIRKHVTTSCSGTKPFY